MNELSRQRNIFYNSLIILVNAIMHGQKYDSITKDLKNLKELIFPLESAESPLSKDKEKQILEDLTWLMKQKITIKPKR